MKYLNTKTIKSRIMIYKMNKIGKLMKKLSTLMYEVNRNEAGIVRKDGYVLVAHLIRK